MTAAASTSGSVSDAAIHNAAQAHIEADALFDSESKRKSAAECWQGLAMIQDMHSRTMDELGRQADQIAARASKQWTPPDPSIYTLHTLPPQRAAAKPSAISGRRASDPAKREHRSSGSRAWRLCRHRLRRAQRLRDSSRCRSLAVSSLRASADSATRNAKWRSFESPNSVRLGFARYLA
jgi:hypothetical protein